MLTNIFYVLSQVKWERSKIFRENLTYVMCSLIARDRCHVTYNISLLYLTKKLYKAVVRSLFHFLDSQVTGKYINTQEILSAMWCEVYTN